MIGALYNFLRPLASPVGFIWLLCIVGAFVLLKRKQRLGALFLAIAAFLMSLLGGRTAVYLLGSLERPYIRQSLADLPRADAIVLLGGGLEPTKNDPLGFNLNEAGDRFLTAVQLTHLRKADALLLGGIRKQIDGREVTEGALLTKLLESWGMTNVALIPLPFSVNTHDEAVHTAKLAKEKSWSRILLVTSAAHMRRAEAVFRTQGLDVIPVACDFVRPGMPNDELPKPYPIRGGFKLMENYWHEKAGWWVYRWRGWISKEAAQKAP